MSRIVLEGVAKRFGDHVAVDHVDLAIESGAFTVFVGPSGCGKTTLLRLIAGLEHADAGRLLIDGADMTATPPARRGLAMVFQSYALYPHMSVRANIGFALKLAHVPAAAIAERVDRVAAMLNLTPYLDRRPAALSGGQRQRVAIGRAIVREPGAFLFDEPLSNLDAALRGRMRLELRQLQRELGATAIYVTHDQAEAMTMADRIVAFRDGRVEQAGAPLDLYDRPANRFVAGFIGAPAMNFVEGDRAAAAGAHALGIRPEHLVPDPDGWPAAVASVERLGAESHVHLRLDDGAPLAMRVVEAEPPAPGARLAVAPLPGRAHRFDAAGQALA